MPINKHVVVFILFMYDLGNTYSFAIFQSIFAIFLSLIDERESSIKKLKIGFLCQILLKKRHAHLSIFERQAGSRVARLLSSSPWNFNCWLISFQTFIASKNFNFIAEIRIITYNFNDRSIA